jgi:uncharacterized protein (TIGR02271 family)
VSRGDERGHTRHDEGDGGETHAKEGAVAGVVTGASVGGLWALGIAAGVLPAIGPVIAGGTLAAILASAAGGAAAGGLVGSLIGLGIPEEEAEYYHGELHQGRTIVTVKSEGRYSEAHAILHRFGASDYHSAATTGASASIMSDSTASTREAANARAASTRGGGRKIQLSEEELHVSKQPVQTGEVTVRKEVRTEHKTIDVPVAKEEVVIERHAASGRAGEIGEGQEIRVPVSEEHVHVEKEPRVREEVTVGKRRREETKHVSGTVKKEELKVEEHGDVHVKGGRQRR